MPEVRTKMVWVVRYQCDQCFKGALEPTGVCLEVHPPLYVHKCSNCEATMNFPACYPTLEPFFASSTNNSAAKNDEMR